MTHLRTLAILVASVVVISTFYAFSFRGEGPNISITISDDDDHIIRQTIRGDKGEFVYRNDDQRIKASWNGKYTLDATANAIASVDDELEIEFKSGDVEERATFENDDGDMKVRFYNDGEETSGQEANAAADAIALKFLRASGQMAEQRVSLLVDRGGAAAVLDEIDLLYEGNQQRKYIEILAAKTDLGDNELGRIIDILKNVGNGENISSAVGAILENQTLDDEELAALVETASLIEEDYEIRRMVEVFSGEDFSDRAADAMLAQVRRIESDYDLRLAIEAMLGNSTIEPALAANLLEIARDNLDSNYDARLVLTESAVLFGDDDTFRQAWIGVYNEIDDAYEKRLALLAIADQVSENPQLTDLYRSAVNDIEEEYDRRKALEAIDD